jgi:hypothetical protein
MWHRLDRPHTRTNMVTGQCNIKNTTLFVCRRNIRRKLTWPYIINRWIKPYWYHDPTMWWGLQLSRRPTRTSPKLEFWKLWYTTYQLYLNQKIILHVVMLDASVREMVQRKLSTLLSEGRREGIPHHKSGARGCDIISHHGKEVQYGTGYGCWANLREWLICLLDTL